MRMLNMIPIFQSTNNTFSLQRIPLSLNNPNLGSKISKQRRNKHQKQNKNHPINHDNKDHLIF
jgi:hypothetical protein